jgi:hypothetical protein
MFYPKCPKCGGESEPDFHEQEMDRRNRLGFHAGGNMARGHPLAQAALVALRVGREAYKRIPGGGGKRCKSCGHNFT